MCGDAAHYTKAAKKIPNAPEGSLYYLVGEGINSKFDKKIGKRLLNIETLKPTENEHVLSMRDAFLAKN